MHTWKRLVWFLALTTVLALTAACGGAAEEPAEEAPPAEEPAPVTETAPEPELMPEPEEPAPPTQPQLVGDIVQIGEEEFDWTTTPSREVPGEYYWVLKLRNDTTQTLNITVTCEILNDEENVIKTDHSTERVSPAQEATFRFEGEMNRDDSRAVAFTSFSWDWEIVEG